MCYILAAKKINKEDENVYDDRKLGIIVKEIITEKFMENPHGFYVNASGKEIRTMDMGDATDVLYPAELNNLVVHARMATVGKENKSNVHGWNRKGWVFLHNGHFSGYAGQGKVAEKSDSLMFFEEFVQGMADGHIESDAVEIIKDICDQKQFSGRAMLYDGKEDKMYLFGDFEMYIVDRQYIILSSTKIDFGFIHESEYIHGFNLTRKVASQLKIEHKDIDGIGVVDNWSTDIFKYRWLGKLKESSYYGGYGRQGVLYDSRKGFTSEAGLAYLAEEEEMMKYHGGHDV